MPVRVVHRGDVVGMTAAGEAKALANRFTQDATAGIEDTGDNSGIELGNETFEQCRSVHHRNSGHGYVVFNGEGLVLE